MFLRVVSVILVLAALIGWAMLQSPALRGPYATPDPSGGVTFSQRTPITPAPAVVQLAVPVNSATSPFACMQIQQTRTGYGFVGDRPVTLTVVFPSPPPGVETFTVIWGNGPAIAWRTCLPESPTPTWRLTP